MPKKQKDGRYRAKIVVIPGEKPVWLSGRTIRELEKKEATSAYARKSRIKASRYLPQRSK